MKRGGSGQPLASQTDSPASAMQACGAAAASGLAPDRRLDLDHADVWYWPGFLTTARADALFEELSRTIHWQGASLRMFGREIAMPRQMAWVADDDLRYRYSGVDMPPQIWPAELNRLRRQLEHCLQESFNGVLLNHYRDGRDSMGWHADDETELGPAPVIASISLGARRRFHFRPRQPARAGGMRLDLEHGSLLLMQGATQQHWRHQLPKTRQAVGPRINATFRRILRPGEVQR